MFLSLPLFHGMVADKSIHLRVTTLHIQKLDSVLVPPPPYAHDEA